MAPPRYQGVHRRPATRMASVARAAASLAVLSVLAVLFLDALLITVGLLTPVVAALRPLRAWLRDLDAPSVPTVSTASGR
ncbi:hypothetical protein Q3W71_22535 [Micromonospora sp. C28SCA-DRY-2]|uniref:hypothetical protein n=1 Tax=Micromonospora sp. C28SCA-DRY-2 TaxID=3059522 RepID=UPI002675E6E4|nr:hypothetical protein [Micromonospora sp. C28SCA-DRY-2]MDO3704446.1 hypothetical protein [Micromonospora sp. C28SCA-DRY-2]